MKNVNPLSPPESPTSPISKRFQELHKLLESLNIDVPPPINEPSFLEEESGFELLFEEIKSKEMVEVLDYEIDEEREEEEEDDVEYFNTFPIKEEKQIYIDLESPINVISRLYYGYIMNGRLELRRDPSNPKKTCNFLGRVRGLSVFIRNFTYICDFVIFEDVRSVIDMYLGEMVLEKPFVKESKLVYNHEEGTVFLKRKERM
ncbi:hypothetical protein Tco_0772253 [Tanacetum coccineum]|uniref:Protein kinase-like domain, concanavalin A-like lectin/glucanase domain protein n=1 Tax=Tanacetum coccineum TaxID=301880 RepID=A0ABQ4ZKA4_9ASTR